MLGNQLQESAKVKVEIDVVCKLVLCLFTVTVCALITVTFCRYLVLVCAKSGPTLHAQGMSKVCRKEAAQAS